MTTLLVALAAWSLPLQSARDVQPYVLENVRLELRPDAPEVTLVLRDGRIEGPLAERAEPPAGARKVDGRGLYALPAFLDAYSRTGCATPAPVAQKDEPVDPRADVGIDMREANRKGIQPAFAAARVLALAPEQREAWRAQGFCALLSSPGGELLSGSSALAATRDGAAREVVLRPAVFDHAGFTATGEGYPSTLMGGIAQLRQFFLDARRHAELVARRETGRPGPRPAFDLDLDWFGAPTGDARRLACEADSAADIARWLRLADELDLAPAIVGGREAWKLADRLAELDVPVILTLEWGDEPASVEEPDAAETSAAPAPGADRIYEEPLAVRKERRRLWEASRDCAARLAEQGVSFAFGSGSHDAKELLARVRKLVEAGLASDVALAALTSQPARILGVEGELGRIEPGASASLALWTAPPFEKGARVAWIFVEGFAYPMDLETKDVLERPAKGVDVTGVWVFEFEGGASQLASADLEMTPEGKVSGTIEFVEPGESGRRVGQFEGQVSGARLKLAGKVRVGSFETEVAVEGEVEGDRITGEMIWRWSEGADTTAFTAQREPREDER